MRMKRTTPTAWSSTSPVETDQLGRLAVRAMIAVLDETHIGGERVAVLEDEITSDTVAGLIVAVLAEIHGENEIAIGNTDEGSLVDVLVKRIASSS